MLMGHCGSLRAVWNVTTVPHVGSTGLHSFCLERDCEKGVTMQRPLMGKGSMWMPIVSLL